MRVSIRVVYERWLLTMNAQQGRLDARLRILRLLLFLDWTF